MRELIKKILREQTEELQIFYKPGDKKWEYTLIDDVWHTRARGSDNKWLNLGSDKYKVVVQQLDKIFLNKGDYRERIKDFFKDNQKGEDSKSSCDFILPVAWPTYEPKIEEGSSDTEIWMAKMYACIMRGDCDSKEGTYGKLGHGGVGLIARDGRVGLFEFGRYEGANKGMGITRQQPVPIKAKFTTDKRGRCRVSNLQQVAQALKGVSYGQGKKLPMFGHLVRIPDIKGAFSFASANTQRKYRAIDLEIGDDEFNCGTFIYDVAEAGGLEMGSYCFPDPESVVDSFERHSLQRVTA